MTEPRWLTKAKSYIGQREIAGRRHNPNILRWWILIQAGFTDDETPWCAGFVGGVLEECGIRSARSARALSYLNWGAPLDKPVPGCIAVFTRGKGAGHVGFYVGEDGRGNPQVLGGNQGDAVTVATYPKSRLRGYRWPSSEPLPSRMPLPLPRPRPRPADIPPPPDVEPVDAEPPAGGLSAKIQHWMNVIATAIGTGFASLMDWRVAAVVVAGGVIVFAVIWFTKMRRK